MNFLLKPLFLFLLSCLVPPFRWYKKDCAANSPFCFVVAASETKRRRLKGSTTTTRKGGDSCGFLSIQDGLDPDWDKVQVTHEDGLLTIDIFLDDPTAPLDGHEIYLYGDQHQDRISIGKDSEFTMWRVVGQSIIEKMIYYDKMEEKYDSTQVISIQIPLLYFEDISSKNIWVDSTGDISAATRKGAQFGKCPSLSQCVYGLDESDGVDPDLKSLTVSYDDTSVSIRLNLYQESSVLPNFIYLYGIHRDVINLYSSGSYAVRRDHGADGHFEEEVCKGSIDFNGRSIWFTVPMDCMPDISEKRIWVYSMDSKDRLPDKGGDLTFASSTGDCPPEEEETGDSLKDLVTVDSDATEHTGTVDVTDSESGDKVKVQYDVVTREGGISSLTSLRDMIDKVDCDFRGKDARVTISFDKEVSLPPDSLFNSEILVIDGSLFGSCGKETFGDEPVDGYLFVDSETRESSNTILVSGRPASLFDLFEESKLTIVNGGKRRRMNDQSGQLCVKPKKEAESQNGLLKVEVGGSVCALARLDRLDVDLSGGLNMEAVFSFALTASVNGKYTLSRDLPELINLKIPLLRKVVYGIRFKWFDGLLPDIRIGFFLEPEIVAKLKPSASFSFDSKIEAELPIQTVTMVVRGTDVDVKVSGDDSKVEGTVTSDTSLKAELKVEGFVGISPTVAGYLLNDYVSFRTDIPTGLFLSAATQVPQFPACTEKCEDLSPSCAAAHDGEIKASVGLENVELSYKVDLGELGLDPIEDKFAILESFSYEILKVCVCCDLPNLVPCREDYCLATPEPTPKPTVRPTLRPTRRPTPPPALPCAAIVTPGNGISTRFSVEMGRTRGSFLLSYNNFDIPDRIQISYEGQVVYDTMFPISGCHNRISISFGPGASTQVDFLVTSKDSGTQWEVATGCPSSTGPPDIGCSGGTAPPCHAYPSVNNDYAGCSCQAVTATSGLCGTNSQFPFAVSGGVCDQSSQVLSYACCCRKSPTAITNPSPPKPQPTQKPISRPPPQTPRPQATRPKPVPRPPANVCGGNCACWRLYCPASRPNYGTGTCLNGGFCCCS